MTRGRVETVQRACDAWGRGDLSTIRDVYTDDVIADGGELWPEGRGGVQGVDAVIEAFESIMSAFEKSELIPEGFLEVEDTLVVPLLWRGVASTGHSAVEQRLVGTYEFSGDRIAVIRWYMSLDSALADLGLPNSAASGLVAA